MEEKFIPSPASARTVCSRPLVTDEDAVRVILARYDVQGVAVRLLEGRLLIQGLGWPDVTPLLEDGTREEERPGEWLPEMMLELAPYLAETLFVRSVGAPFTGQLEASEWLVEPGGKSVRETGFFEDVPGAVLHYPSPPAHTLTKVTYGNSLHYVLDGKRLERCGFLNDADLLEEALAVIGKPVKRRSVDLTEALYDLQRSTGERYAGDTLDRYLEANPGALEAAVLASRAKAEAGPAIA